ncbi:phosphatase PAP2 family protein [Methylibium sp.]|uniref:phosphatase PAP2 family protein n=1 Tax=Methylibium sp. TaxID=2067992 RepID=UPI003D14DC64
MTFVMLLWHWFTRFGESGIVIPMALSTALWWWWATPSRRPLLAWLALLGSAAFLTLVTKVAFMGWGLGSVSLDFTGLSGHAMLAAAIYPVLLRTLCSPVAVPPRWAIGAGYALAALVSLSRVIIGAHSGSEVVLGFAVGAAASATALALETRQPPPIPRHWLWLGLAAWLTLMPVVAAPSGTHGMVQRLAKKLSDRDQLYTRADLHRARLPG